MSPLLEFKNVSLTYSMGNLAIKVLQDINITLKAGEVVALTGPSGSGKSSLLMLASGMERATSGNIFVDGKEITNLSEDKVTIIRRDKIGIVFQAFHLHPELTASENASLPLEFAGKKDSQIAAKTFLAKLGLKERLDHYPSQLSGGEQQRVALVRALINEQKILLADEPTGNLDQTNTKLVFDLLLNQVKKQNSTALIVTHDLELASKCDTILYLLDGKLMSKKSTKKPARKLVKKKS